MVVVLLTCRYIQKFVAAHMLVLNAQLMIWKVALAIMTRGRKYAALCRMGKVARITHQEDCIQVLSLALSTQYNNVHSPNC